MQTASSGLLSIAEKQISPNKKQGLQHHDAANASALVQPAMLPAMHAIRRTSPSASHMATCAIPARCATRWRMRRAVPAMHLLPWTTRGWCGN